MSRAAAAEVFYCDRLGFRRLFAYRPDEVCPDPCYMGLERDGVVLHVSSFPGDGVSGGVVVFVRVDDVDALHAELVAKGVPIAMVRTNQTWGHREMYVRTRTVPLSASSDPSAGRVENGRPPDGLAG